MSDCNEIPAGYSSFTITVPPPRSQPDYLMRICIGDSPFYLTLSFIAAGQPQGLPVAATALQTATDLANALNNLNTATLNTARDTYGMYATRYNNVVTVYLMLPRGDGVAATAWSTGCHFYNGVASLIQACGATGTSIDRWLFDVTGAFPCQVELSCAEIGVDDRRGVRIVFPPEGGEISFMEISSDGTPCLTFDFQQYVDDEQVVYIPNGTTGDDLAESFAVLLMSDPVNALSGLAAVGGDVTWAANVVTITWDANALDCCGESVTVDVTENTLGIAWPYNFGWVCCDTAGDLTDPDCAQTLGDNVLIQRVQFTNVSQTFGPGATKKRYQVKPGTPFGASISPASWSSDPRSFDYPGYSTFDDWINGFTNYYNTLGNGWFTRVRYLGGGVVEFEIDAANAEIQAGGVAQNGLTIQAVGVGLNTYYNSINYAPLTFAQLGVTDCTDDDTIIVIEPPVDDPPVPPTPPDYTPPEVPPTPDYVAPACREFFDFECCGYSVGGVRRVLVIDAKYVTGYTLDDDGAVTSVATSLPVWYELCLKDNVTLMDVTEDTTDAGTRFSVSLAAATYFMSQQNRNVIETLRRRRLVIIIEDRNGRYWLTGEDGAARVENIAGTTGAARADNNNYNFVFRAWSRTIPRTVLGSFVENLQISANDCGQYIGQPLDAYPLAALASCLLNDMNANPLVSP